MIAGFKIATGHEQIVAELSSDYKLMVEAPAVENFAVYDTFDWRLYQSGYALHSSEDILFLLGLPKGDAVASDELQARPVFISDFPEGEVKVHLGPILDVRALLKLADAQKRSIVLRILNQDEKTVARVVYEGIRLSSGDGLQPLIRLVQVMPVRGYPRYEGELNQHFRERDLPVLCYEDIYMAVLDAAGRQPGGYSSKLNLQLSPDMRSDEATKIILRFLLEIMQTNEAGIQADIDTEFLHDFRVAIRRTRSALTQIRDVFPLEILEHYKRVFTALGRLTNTLRDLDVYLLNEDTYKGVLPASIRADIDPLFDYLKEQRVGALNDVRRGLNSPQYKELMRNWGEFLDEPPSDGTTAQNADRPILDLARERINKRYRRIVKIGGQIIKDMQDEKLHALRIECKKLRYLMEFFTSLFPLSKITPLIKQLKKLQDNLGDFNDLHIQQDYLLEVSEELPLAGARSTKAFVAIGCLVGALAQEQQRVKDEFEVVFTSFASPVSRKKFKELFETSPTDREAAG